MKILITAADGFIGKNLVIALHARGYHDLLTFDADAPVDQLERYCTDCEFVYHLAAASRPKQHEEFLHSDFGLTDSLLRLLNKHKNRCPIMFASSTQAALPNLYGRSKKAGEELLDLYAHETGAKVYIYRLPHVFGKWSKPSQNGVVATFCYNVSHDLPVVINDESTQINLAYIDDVAESLCDLIDDVATREGPYCIAPVQYSATLGDIASRIRSFRSMRKDNTLPNMSEPLTRKLYATYVSFLPVMEFAYPLEMREDESGTMTEFLRLSTGGQVSISVCKPSTVRGEHWHHTRAEKFLIVAGTGVIRFRRADSQDVLEYPVSGKKHVVVDIPVGYVHNVENTGKTDLVMLMWASQGCDDSASETVKADVVQS